MRYSSLFQALADATLVLHVLFVLFVVLGLLLILVGGWRGWDWVRNLWFRLAHLAAIGFVVAESWLGVVCPLTTLESWLRRLAGQIAYDDDFIAFWLRRFLFFEAPPWAFTLGYSLFGAAVVLGWWLVPPRARRT